MRGLLLAGLRLASGAPAAALRVAGLPLLARAAFVARDAGVTTAVIVAERPLHSTLRAALGPAELGLALTFADPTTDRDAVLAALGGDEPVALIRADVAHTRHAAPALRDAEPGELLVDERAAPIRGAEGLLLATGPTWVGLAVLRPDQVGALLDELGRDPVRGDLLALDEETANGRGLTVPVTGLPWQAVRSAAETRAAERLLLESSGHAADGWLTAHVRRPLSRRITRAALELPLRPSHVTALVAVVTVAGCAVMAGGGRYLLPLAGALLLFGASILAGCDGELARLRYQGSLAGAWLDAAVRDLTPVACCMAVTAALARTGHSSWWTVIGVVTAACTAVAVALSYAQPISTGGAPPQDAPEGGVDPAGGATTAWARRLLAGAWRRDAVPFVVLAGALVGLLQLPLLFLLLGAATGCAAHGRRFLERRPPSAGAGDEPPGDA